MELTEKQGDYLYCDGPRMTFRGLDGELCQVSEDAFSTPMLIMIVDNKHKPHITKIKCCPMCGRTLGENEDEYLPIIRYICTPLLRKTRYPDKGSYNAASLVVIRQC